MRCRSRSLRPLKYTAESAYWIANGPRCDENTLASSSGKTNNWPLVWNGNNPALTPVASGVLPPVLSVIAPLSEFEGHARVLDYATSMMRSAMMPWVRKRVCFGARF
jgi:hypothetical protein